MEVPSLNTIKTSLQAQAAFGGYNHNAQIGDSEWYDELNMTSDDYPLMSPRHKRGTYASPANPQGLIAKDALLYVDGSSVVFNGYTIDIGLSTDVEDCPKTLVSMGAYVIILPDKKYLNTADLSDYGDIENRVATSGRVRFELCRVDGTEVTVTYTQSTEPESPINGEYWIDTSSTPHTLKRYSDYSEQWATVPSTYVKIQSSAIAGFDMYDGVKISGLKGTTFVDYNTQESFEDSQLEALEGTVAVYAKGDDYIVVVGMIDQTREISNVIRIERTLPIMDFVIESGNRLWGCRYGLNADGQVVNEIYASKLGDFRNWNCFMGLSTDSYVASCGTDGQWTGAYTYLGYPIFFKQDCLHKVYGSYPAQYQIQDTACRGVQKGSSRSLAMVNETLYYKSRTGICAYDGSLPSEVSYAFGNKSYSDAVGGSHGNKYYISMMDEDGEYNLFVLDVQRGVWHREDNTQVDAFCSCRNELYYIDHATKRIKTVFGSGTLDTDRVKWMAESGTIGTFPASNSLESYATKKYISQLNVRMKIDAGTIARFYIQYDSMGEWEHLCSVTTCHLKSIYVPIRPHRCDHFKIRIEGEGDAKIYSIIRIAENGSSQ